MNAQHNISQIASLLGRHKSSMSRELRCNSGSRGYRLKRDSELEIDEALKSTGYIVRPFASWKRGLGFSQNLIGVLRKKSRETADKRHKRRGN
jgi:IS30 family transposase